MKQVRSNGKELRVRHIGPVEVRLVPADPHGMIKPVDEIMDDDEAAAYVDELLASGHVMRADFEILNTRRRRRRNDTPDSGGDSRLDQPATGEDRAGEDRSPPVSE